MSDTVTYKAIPYPLPDEFSKRLLELGKRCVKERSLAHPQKQELKIDLELAALEVELRSKIGVQVTRKVFERN